MGSLFRGCIVLTSNVNQRVTNLFGSRCFGSYCFGSYGARWGLAVIAALFTGLAQATDARADYLHRIDRVNRLSVVDKDQCLTCEDPDVISDALSNHGFKPFDRSLDIGWAQASQTSTIGLIGFSVSTFAHGQEEGTEFGSNTGEAFFSFTFDVTATTAFSLTGLLESDTTEPPIYTTTYSSLSLQGPNLDLAIDTYDDPETAPGVEYFELSQVEVNVQGVLEPGRYTLELLSIAPEYFGGLARANLHFVAPEPSTSLACVAGLTALMVRRRRNRC